MEDNSPQLPLSSASRGQKPVSLVHRLLPKVRRQHEALPWIRRCPLQAIAIIFLLIIVNVVTWIVAAIVLHFHPSFVSTAVLSYTLGLRHALDADHISAIDLMTRRLLASNRQSATVGTFFSLGHSTIVIITSLTVAATAGRISSKFSHYSTIGSIIGSSVSAGFLILLGLANVYILYRLVVQMRRVLRLCVTASPEVAAEEAWNFEPNGGGGGGVLFRIFRKLFKLIDRPWKMYPLGVLFGLGFDTSSEIALLGISSVEGSKGTGFWVIMLFPVLFTVGMCLVDTVDGAVMLTIYLMPASSASNTVLKEDVREERGRSGEGLVEEQERAHTGTATALARRVKDPVPFLYYSIVLTALTVVVALVIGTIQLLTMILNAAEPEGTFWDGVENAGEHYEVIGGGICGSFVVVGGLSVLAYGPWKKRWVDDRTRNCVQNDGEHNDGGEVEKVRDVEENSYISEEHTVRDQLQPR